MDRTGARQIANDILFLLDGGSLPDVMRLIERLESERTDMICVNCERQSKDLVNTFTQKERLFLLGSIASMMRYVMAGESAEDKMVGSSVTTKILLSFTPEMREGLLKQFRKELGTDITLKSCGHGVVEVVQ